MSVSAAKGLDDVLRMGAVVSWERAKPKQRARQRTNPGSRNMDTFFANGYGPNLTPPERTVIRSGQRFWSMPRR